jgi:hypothetical protein
MLRENNEMRGALTMQVTDRQGLLVYEMRQKNRIVTTGRSLVAQLFAGVAGGVPPGQVTHMGVGTNATAPGDGDGALKAERAPRRAISSVDYSEISEGTGADEVKRVRARLTAVFDFGDANGTEPLREAGIFTAETGGVMYNRVVFEPVTKTDAFKLTLLWDIVF